MRKLAIYLASKISAELKCDSEKETVIAYGLTAIIQILITLILIILFSSLTGTVPEALFVCLSGSLLRRYSGGAHASSAEICTAFSTLYCVAASVLAKGILFRLYDHTFMLACLLVCYALAFVIVRRFAPVDSVNKPIRSESKRRRLRKDSCITLIVYAAVSAALYMAGFRALRFRSLGIALLFGLLWQIFTLTPIGGRFVHGINNLFSLFGGGEKK